MNIFDIVIIVILGFCLIRGIFRGLVKEVSSIVGVLGGAYAAYSYYPDMAKLLSRWIFDPVIQNIIGFLIIFSLIFFLISLLGIVIKYLMKIVFLGGVDRVCGGGFGLIKGVLISAVLLFMLTSFLPKNSDLVKDSMVAPGLNLVSEKMVLLVSSDMKDKFLKKIEEYKKVWKNLK
ncbi:MAG: CvpA family protein [Desulfobacterales bacterium]|nr:CvpA family protein [Desulfobacterales bacterium]